MNIHITRKLILAIVVASVLIGAVAAVTLFTHNFPAVTTTAAVFTTTCGTTAASPLTASPTSVITGTSGGIRFTCGAAAALTVGLAAPATPTFMLPAGYTSITLIGHAGPVTAQDTCPGTLGPITLTSGTAIPSLTVTQTVDYCALFSSAPAAGFAAFTVTWSQ